MTVDIGINFSLNGPDHWFEDLQAVAVGLNALLQAAIGPALGAGCLRDAATVFPEGIYVRVTPRGVDCLFPPDATVPRG